MSFCALRGGVPNKILLFALSENIWTLKKMGWLGYEFENIFRNSSDIAV